MQWTVGFTKKADKQKNRLPKKIKDTLVVLIREIEISGPVRGSWPNYSKLPGDRHHCHLTPSYVAVWEVTDKEIKLVEVSYVGTREKAPY